MTRISLRETYDNRSVIAQIAKVTDTAEDAAETVQEKAAEINDAITDVNAAVQAAEGAVTTANAASASAQQSAQTVAGYENRLGAVETGLSTAQHDISAVEDNVEDLSGDLNAVTLRVQTAEGQIVTIQGRVTALETADGQNVKINAINDYAVGLTGNQTDILGNKSFKGTVDFKSVASFSTNDFVSALVKTIYSNTDANNTILEERQVTKESANTIRFDTRNRMSKDGTNANRIDTYLRTVVNETTETVTLQLFILVYENNVQVRGKSVTIATLNAS